MSGGDNLSAEQTGFNFYTGLTGSTQHLRKLFFGSLTPACQVNSWGSSFDVFKNAQSDITAINNISCSPVPNKRPRIKSSNVFTPNLAEPEEGVIPEEWFLPKKVFVSKCIFHYTKHFNERRHPLIDEMRKEHSYHTSRAKELVGLFHDDMYKEGIVNNKILKVAEEKNAAKYLFGPNGVTLYLEEIGADFFQGSDEIFDFSPASEGVTQLTSLIKTANVNWRIHNIETLSNNG